MEGAGKRFEAVYWPSNEVMQISIDQASALLFVVISMSLS